MNEKMTKDWERCVDFHGHSCPGLAIGFRATVSAIEKMKISFSEDEDIVCVTENDACGVDGIQALLGCTFGKGNLIYRGTGKMAFSFFNRKNGEKFRFMLKALGDEMGREERQAFILDAPVSEVFAISTPAFDLPEKARLFSTLTCAECGESAPEHKMRLQGGKIVCLDCFKDYSRGFGL